MNFRTTIVLFILLVGAGVFFFFATRNPQPTTSQTPTQETGGKGRALFTVSSGKLEKLTVRPSQGPAIELARQDGKWQMLQPIAWPADGSKVDNFLNALTSLHSRGGVEMNASNASSTGLDHPRYVIDAWDTDGKKIQLDVGNHSALGNDLYVKASGASQADLVPAGTLGEDLNNGAEKLSDSLRSKQLVSVPEFQVRQAEFFRRHGELVLEKVGSDWKLRQPVKLDADSTEASSLLDTVTGLQASEFSTEAAADQAGARLNEPRAVVWLSEAAPSTQPSANETPINAASHSAPATRPTSPASPTSAPSNLAAEAATLASRGGTTIIIGQPVDIQAQKVWVKVFDPSHAPVVAQAELSTVSFDRLSQATPLSLRDKRVLDIDPASVASFTLEQDTPASAPGAATVHPAVMRQITIERRKLQPPVFGPALPPRSKSPTTHPVSPATQTAIPTTQSAHPSTRPTNPATGPGASLLQQHDPTRSGSGAEMATLHPVREEVAASSFPSSSPAARADITASTASISQSTAPTSSASQAPRSVTGDQASTHPTTAPTTQSGNAKTRVAAPTTQAALAATQPVLSSGVPATQPAANVPMAWYFASGGEGKADDGQVNALLDTFHPLRADKYVEKSPATQPAGGRYTLTIRTRRGSHGEAGRDYVVHFLDPGGTSPVIGIYTNLTFEVDRGIIDKLTGDFKTAKPVTAPPSFPGATGGFPGGAPFGR